MARRVNTRFLVIFSLIVLTGLAVAFVIRYPLMGALRHERVKKLVDEADRLMTDAEKDGTAQTKKEKLETAVRNYVQAAGSDSRNADLFVKLGDAYTKLTLYDVFQYIRASRQAWDKALEINPTHLVAQRRLMESWYQETQINPRAEAFTMLQERAESVHKLDPKDRRAHSLMYIAPLNQWVANIETPANRIEAAIQELTTLLEEDPKNPENSDLVFFVATAKAKRGADLRRSSADSEGNKLIDQARRLFEDSLRVQDDNAAMHFRYYGLLVVLANEETDRDKNTRLRELAKKELGRAKELIKPEDKNYVKICIAAHEQLIRAKEGAKAEQVLLEAYSNKPDDQRLRLAIARLWRFNSAKRAEAIALLQQPITNIGFEGVEAKLRLGLEIETNIELATMLIDDFSAARDLPKAEREDKLKLIQKTHQAALDKAGETSGVLKLQGKIELLKGGTDAPIRAIKAYEKAQTQYKMERGGNEDLDLMWLLARAYSAANMTGQAKTQLIKFQEKNAEYLPVRMMLAQLLVAENDVASARRQVDLLAQQLPDDQDVQRLVIAVSDPAREKPRIAAAMAKLPETSRAERLVKAMIAANHPVNNPAEAQRLYELILKSDPADFETVNQFRELLVNQGKKAEALTMLRAAQQANPTDKKIGLIITQVEGASVQKMQEDAEKLIREMNPDPYQCALKLYELEMVQSTPMQGANEAENKKNEQEAQKHKAKAYQYLLEAEKVRPDELRVMDLLFQYHLTERNWDKAAQYVDKLAAKNGDTAEGRIYRFRLAMVKNDLAAATNYARDLTTKYPEFARSWVYLAQAYQATGNRADLDQAISNYTAALDKQTENIDALVGIISCLYRAERPNDAYQYIQRARKYHPSNPFFRAQYISWHMVWGSPAQVLPEAIEDRDARPEDVSRWVTLGRVYFASARKRDKDFDKHIAGAKSTFMDAIKKWPENRMLWAHLIDIAELSRDLAYGETAMADMASREQLKNSPDPLLLKVELYLRFAQVDKAEGAMKEAMTRFPENMEFRRRLAAFYTQQKKYPEALKLLDPASPDPLVRQQIVEIYMLDGKFNEAEKLLTSLLAGKPNDAQLHALLGVVLLNLKRTAQALEELNTALNIDPRNIAALYSRGTIRLKSAPPQVDEAIKDLTALRDLSAARGVPHVEGRVDLAIAYRLKGELENAKRELNAAIKMAPGRDDVRVSLCGLYASAKPPEWGEVERLLKDAMEREPKRPMWRRMQAKMLSARNQHDAAVTVIREAIAMVDPQSPTAAAERGDMARDYFDILEAAKNWPQLIVECDQAFKSSPQTEKEAWWIYVKRAVARRNRDQKNEAMTDFQKAFEIAQDQGNPDVLFSIVDKIRLNMGVDAAIDRVTLLVANAKDLDVPRWEMVLAYLHLINKNTAKAQELVEKARTAVPNMKDRDKQTTLTIAGTVFMMCNEYDKARAVYEQLLEVKKNDLASLNNLACIWAEHVDPPNVPKAIKYSSDAYDEMTRLGKNEASILDTHGWVNVLSGGAGVDTGIELLNRAIKAGEIPEAYYHLGKAYLMKKFAREAKVNLDRASELLQERIIAGNVMDEQFKQKIDEARLEVEKALLQADVGRQP